MTDYLQGLSEKGILLSICIPTYNRCQLLRRALRSLEGGTPETEVLVFDNSDNDESEEAVREELSEFRGPWYYHRNIPSIGPVENVNCCIKASSGRFVYILHDDDFLLPKGLSSILAILKKHPNEYVFTFGVRIVDIHEKLIHVESMRREKILTSRTALLKTLTNSSFIRMPSIVIHRSAYMKVGYWNPKCAPPDDIDMFVRLFMEFNLFRSSAIVAAYTIHKGAWTQKMFNSHSIKILLNIFNEVERRKIFSDAALIAAKGSFFSHFILGGTYRSIRSWDMNPAKEIFDLFKLKEMAVLTIPFRYQMIKLVFRAILLLSDVSDSHVKKSVKVSG